MEGEMIMKEQRKEQAQVTDEQLPEAASGTQLPEGETGAPALSGTVGRIAKWLSPLTLGDSGMMEDSLNDVYFSHDIGLAGRVRTGEGIRFGDGSVQTTAFTEVAHDDTLAGKGTSREPLSVAYIKHDFTLTGKGTSLQPLGVAIPLPLGGSTDHTPLLDVTNTGSGFAARFVGGTESRTGTGGVFVSVRDTPDSGGYGGNGITSMGGNCNGGVAGSGVVCYGGTGDTGGSGIDAFGGRSFLLRDNTPAGRFWGNVEIYRYGGRRPDGNLLVSGTVTSGTGMFKIDHPLDPENKYLHHAVVESPDMKTIYDGNVTTDARGEALVQLPGYFEAANRDFRYQLTVIGTFAQATVASEIKENRFLIKTSEPNLKVSWQVTGIRQDAFANAHRIEVEEEKPSDERGYYLHAAEHGQPAERDITSSRHAELMRRVNEARDMALKP
jgi:hypothetical protein